MGRVAALFLIVAALSGCATVTTPVPGLSGAERTALQQRSNDGYWHSLGLLDELRPAAMPATLVSNDEWPVRFVDCMNDAGYGNYEAMSGGYTVTTSETGDPDAELLASYVCYTGYWADGNWYSDAQKQFLYDYYVQELVPCLAVHDAAVWGAPSRDEFMEEGGWWHPYLSFPDAEKPRIYAMTSLPEDCPSAPPGMDDPGLDFLWQ